MVGPHKNKKILIRFNGFKAEHQEHKEDKNSLCYVLLLCHCQYIVHQKILLLRQSD